MRAIELDRPLNFPGEGDKKAVKAGSSKYRGVSKTGKKWKAQIKHNSKVRVLGSFETEEAAVQKYDEAATLLGRPVNCPLASIGLDEGPAVQTYWFN